MASASTRQKRVSKLADEIELADLEGVVIAPGPNLSYYTGVNAQLLERPFLFLMQRNREAHLLAPKLEAGPFKESGLSMTFHEWEDGEGPGHAMKRLLGKIDKNRVWGCEGRVPFGFLDHLLTRGMRFRPADDLLQSIRAVKEHSELESLRQSAKILAAAYQRVPDFLRAGMTERQLSRLITEEVLARGAESVEMCMVQSGPRAADPHSETSEKKIKRGESIVIDSVSFFEGYAADITRTFCIGRDARFEEVYLSVLKAQEKAVAAAREGVVIAKVDAAARGSLTQDGLGERFIHRTGHGLGLEVHEAPYIVSNARETLRSGMVFTIEPGAYIPNKLGVRIEDNLIASSTGSEVTTARLPKKLGWWR